MSKQAEPLENQILSFGEKLNERIYESFSSGEINSEQLTEVYHELSAFAAKAESLFSLLQKDGIRV